MTLYLRALWRLLLFKTSAPMTDHQYHTMMAQAGARCRHCGLHL
jgi:hypothetical protein